MTTAIGTAQSGTLALSMQDLFTVIGRLRDGRNTHTDATAFRQQVKVLVTATSSAARAQGHTEEDVGLALFATIALLDESVFASGLPIATDWARKPLQDELFREHRAGESFFQYLETLLKRDESPVVADLLEVFQTCLLFGLRGRYAPGAQGGSAQGDPERLASISRRVSERIRRIRGETLPVSDLWRHDSKEEVPLTRDPWVSRGLRLLAALSAFGLVLYGLYWLLLPTRVTP